MVLAQAASTPSETAQREAYLKYRKEVDERRKAVDKFYQGPVSRLMAAISASRQ
jgi:hypothetical protein